jgi:DNA-binding transcriptional LysR family regulator
MNLKRLETFVHVAKRRSFSEVADLMNLTQSGVSRQIKTLEEELDVQLLERSTTYVELTPAGRMVYKKAEELLAQWNQLVQECKEIKNELSGSMKIGASTIPAASLLPRIIKSMHDKYPRIEFSIAAGGSSDILNKLQNHQIDAAIVGRKPEHPRLQAQCIAEDRLVLIGSSSHPYLSSFEEIKKHPYIIREKGSGTREAIDQSLRKYGMDPDELRCVAEVGSTETILSLVEAGVGISFVSYWAVQGSVSEKIKIIHELPTDRCFYLVYDTARKSLPLVQAFLQETLKHYVEN